MRIVDVSAGNYLVVAKLLAVVGTYDFSPRACMLSHLIEAKSLPPGERRLFVTFGHTAKMSESSETEGGGRRTMYNV